ncbi:condensation domain-containing protein [Actinomadura sp. 9N407]|uniref:condensation domain-containing protein n=1 Tax=Actinomadura sp. 9N407 TaxID=3375154 RepID=UPI00379A39AC
MAGSGRGTEFPLTAGQRQHFEVMRRNPALRMAIWDCFRIPGELDIDTFTDSVEILVSRHEALRVEVLKLPDGEPAQRIRSLPPRNDLITCQNVIARSEEQFSRYIRHVMVQEQRRAWDEAAYPFRFRLFRYSPTVHALITGFSHMAVDGIGAELLIRDLMRTYADAVADRAPRGLPRRSFTDSVVRRPSTDGGSVRSAERDPSGPLTRFDVPAPDPGERGLRSRQSSLSLTGTRLAALREQADLHGCSEFTWILAAFARTVLGFTSQDRITIAVPVNLRAPAEREVVGMYVMEVPVAVERPRDAGTGRDFVAAVGSAVLRATVRHRRSAAWDQGHPADLFVNYRRRSGAPGREPPALGTTGYLPRIDYQISGIGLRIFSRPDVLDVQVVFESSVFSVDSAGNIFETLIRNLITASGRR